jgi:hypothetical protein
MILWLKVQNVLKRNSFGPLQQEMAVLGCFFEKKGIKLAPVATQDRIFPHYVPNSSIKHSKSDSKDRSQEIL